MNLRLRAGHSVWGWGKQSVILSDEIRFASVPEPIHPSGAAFKGSAEFSTVRVDIPVDKQRQLACVALQVSLGVGLLDKAAELCAPLLLLILRIDRPIVQRPAH